jgi:hypothetical protein
MLHINKFIWDSTTYNDIVDNTFKLLIEQQKWVDGCAYEIIVAKYLQEKQFRVLYVKRVDTIKDLSYHVKRVIKKRSNAIRNAKLRMYDPEDTHKEIRNKENIYGESIKHYTELEIFFEGTPEDADVYIGKLKSKKYYSCDDMMITNFVSHKLYF